MKLTLFFIVAGLFSAQARGVSQKITLDEKDMPLQNVFNSIKLQTGYLVIASKQVVEMAKPVTVSVKGMLLTDFLDNVLLSQGLNYVIDDNSILIVGKGREPNPPGTPDPLENELVFLLVTGSVKNIEGEPLMGVNVMVKGAKNGTTTNAKGDFSINTITGNTLLFTSIGYTPREIRITGNDKLSVILQHSNSLLDETQVIGYGKTSRRLNTGSVSTIKASDIEKQPVTNPLLAMQGRVPGMIITQQSGVPNSTVKVEIRGRTSINSSISNDPLYIVDGVPYTSTLLNDPNPGISGTVGTVTGANAVGSPLNYIDPSSIESIDVLKDADATSIYGSRGANGVVLITTKKGKVGPARLSLTLSQGVSRLAPNQYLDVMNTRQYLSMRREAIQNNNGKPGANDFDLNGTWDTTRNTDWEHLLVGGAAQYTDAQVSLSGGSQAVQYMIGSHYNKQTTVFPGDFSDQDLSFNFSLNAASANQRFKLDFRGSWQTDDNRISGSDLSGFVLLAPDAPAPFKEDGTLNWGGATDDFKANPLQYIMKKYTNKTNNLIASLTPSYRLAPGLELKVQLGFNNLLTNIVNTTPKASMAPLTAALTASSAQYTTNTINSWTAAPQLTYEKSLGKAKIQGLLAGEVQQKTLDGVMLKGTGYVSDAMIGNIKNASSITSEQGSSYSEYKYTAVFGRINYNLADKYILNITARRDGSSRFGPGKQFHTFLSLGTNWIFSNETWVKNNVQALSFGKLRGSYGTTGIDNIGDYKYLDLYAPGGTTTYQGAPVLKPTGLYNPDFAWEETRKLEVGLELGFFKDRILFSVAYYRNRCGNQLLQYPLPYITGFADISANLAATVQNEGIEISLNTTNIKSRGFEWQTNFNISSNRNKLVSFPGLDQSSYGSSFVIGQPISDLVSGARYAGVDPQTGLYNFKRANGTITSNPSGADYVKINTQTKFYGGLINTFNYKGFQLDVFLQFTKKLGKRSNGSVSQGAFTASSTRQSQPVEELDYWHQPGDQATYQKVTNSPVAVLSQYSLWASSDAAYVDASFIRLKNMALYYTLPGNWKEKVKLNSCRIFLLAQNLFTLTRYTGRDPENENFLALPPLRTITAGLQFNF